MPRRHFLRILVLLPILAGLLAWWHSATAYDHLSCSLGHAYVGAGLNSGTVSFDLAASTDYETTGFEHNHEDHAPARFWPPPYSNSWQGFSFFWTHTPGAWMLQLALPLWFLLPFFTALAAFIWHRPRPPLTAFPIEPAAQQPTPTRND